MVDFGLLEAENGDTLWNGGDFKRSFHVGGGLKNRIIIGLLDLKAGRYKLRYTSDDSHSTASYNDIPPQDSSYWGAELYVVNDDDYNNLNKLLVRSNEMTFLNNEDIKTVYCVLNKKVWVGTDDGLALIDSNFVIKNYLHSSSNAKSLSNNAIRDIKRDLHGNLWIATRDGLNKLEVSR